MPANQEILLSARRLQQHAIEPFQVPARFYAGRASALHATARKEHMQEETPLESPDKNGVCQVGGGVTPPRRFGNAVYPQDALAAGIAGVVVAEITVNESGIATHARLLDSVPLLDEAALRSVREWRYDPTIVEGKAVPVKMRVTVNFSTRR